MSKKKWFTPATLMVVLMLLFFGGLGIFFATYELKYYDTVTFGFYLYTMASTFFSVPLHVFLHEIGHLLAGLLSGYEFIMFRFFSSVWIKTDEGLSRRKQNVPGLLGQALMVPPENSDSERPPFLLYHLGGILVNGLTAVAFLLFSQLITDPFTRFFFYISAAMALFLLVMNLLPFKGTDGYNILMYSKNPHQEDEILSILYLYQDMVNGRSFTDIQESIQMNETTDLKNPNTVTLYSIEAAAAFETYDFEKAREIYAHLWENLDDLVDAHKSEVSMNYLFTLLLTDPTHPDVQTIQQSPFYKPYQKVKQADSYRVFAAEALYLEDDDTKAADLLQKGKKEISLAPTVSDENVERLLYEYLERALDSQERTQ